MSEEMSDKAETAPACDMRGMCLGADTPLTPAGVLALMKMHGVAVEELCRHVLAGDEE